MPPSVSAVTVTEPPPALNTVEFIVGLVVPTATEPKLIPLITATGPTRPVIETVCGLPAALSVTFNVATLFAAPGGVPAVNMIPKEQETPAGTETVFVDSKLQLVLMVGATNAKFAAFVPVIVAFVMFRVAVPAF